MNHHTRSPEVECPLLPLSSAGVILRFPLFLGKARMRARFAPVSGPALLCLGSDRQESQCSQRMKRRWVCSSAIPSLVPVRASSTWRRLLARWGPFPSTYLVTWSMKTWGSNPSHAGPPQFVCGKILWHFGDCLNAARGVPVRLFAGGERIAREFCRIPQFPHT